MNRCLLRLKRSLPKENGKGTASVVYGSLVFGTSLLLTALLYSATLIGAVAQANQSVLLVLFAPELDEYVGVTHAVRDDGIANEFQQQLSWPQLEGSYFEYSYLSTTRAYDLLFTKTPPQKLALLLGAAHEEAVEVALAYGSAPTAVKQGDVLLSPVNSLLGLTGSTVSTYYYDTAVGKLYLRLFSGHQEELITVETSGNPGGGSLGPVGRMPNSVESVAPGIYYEYYEIDGSLESQTPVQSGIVANVELSARQRDQSYAFRFIGYLNVPQEDIYTFSLRADSDSRILLGGSPLLNHSGDPAAPTESTQSIALQPGLHHIVVEYTHEDNPTHELLLSWESSTVTKEAVPAARLFFPTAGTTILPSPDAEQTPTTTGTPMPTASTTLTPAPSQTPSATPTGNPGGNSARTQHLPLVIGGARTNNQPPTVSLVQPVADDQFSTTDTITMTALATDDNQVSSVRFYAGNAMLHEDSESPYQFVWQNASVGAHQLTARAVDNHGYSTTSTIVHITVEQAIDTEPRVFFIEPTDGATVTAPISVTMGVANFTLEPAGGVQPNAGHLHIMIDTPCVAVGETIPRDETHLHFGLGQSEAVLMLEPGLHTLCLQAADGIHTALALTDQITITVE